MRVKDGGKGERKSGGAGDVEEEEVREDDEVSSEILCKTR
jgi:hypothetical protein